MTHSLELGRAKVALEVDHAVARTVEGGVAEAARLDDVHRVVDVVAIGDGVIEVERAGLELIRPGRILSTENDDLLDGRLLALEVASVVLVDGEGRLQGRLVELDEVVRASGDAVLTRVEAGELELLGDGVRGEVARDIGALAVVLHIKALAQPVLEAEGHVRHVGQIVEIRDLVGHDGDGVGVVVNEADAGDGGRVAVIVILAADVGQVAGQLRAGIGGHLGAGEDHRPHEVLRGDGLAVVVHQALVDGHGVGLGAVVVDDAVKVGADGRVDDVLAALIGGGDGVIVRHVTDHLVGGVVGPPGARGKVAADLGGAAIDDGALFRGGVLSKGHNAHGHEQGDRQKNGEKLLHGKKPP